MEIDTSISDIIEQLDNVQERMKSRGQLLQVVLTQDIDDTKRNILECKVNQLKEIANEILTANADLSTLEIEDQLT